MPDSTPQNAIADSVNGDSPDEIADATCQLKIAGEGNGSGQEVAADGHANDFPERPGEPDCIYYLRNGVCGYGNKCRYNHPTGNGQGVQYTGELPQRDGHPDCKFFLKTRTCKYGQTCKYHHPLDKHDLSPFQLNVFGLPMRKDEKSCSFYMRNGSCKYGVACRFNHPQPATVGTTYPATGSSIYCYNGSSMPATTPTLIGGISQWPLRNHYVPSPRLQGVAAYAPYVIPSTHSALPLQQSWNMYMGSVSISSADSPGLSHISDPKQHGQPGSSMAVVFPERPDQPECQYYLKTGSCKYGPSCKYHHPKDRNQITTMTIGPHGLPLRKGEPICNFYSTYGGCKYGTACKYDHPFVGYYNHSPAAFPFPEPAAFLASPLERGSQVTLSADNSFTKTSKVPEEVTSENLEQKDLDKAEDEDSSRQTSPSHGAAD